MLLLALLAPFSFIDPAHARHGPFELSTATLGPESTFATAVRTGTTANATGALGPHGNGTTYHVPHPRPMTFPHGPEYILPRDDNGKVIDTRQHQGQEKHNLTHDEQLKPTKLAINGSEPLRLPRDGAKVDPSIVEDFHHAPIPVDSSSIQDSTAAAKEMPETFNPGPVIPASIQDVEKTAHYPDHPEVRTILPRNEQELAADAKLPQQEQEKHYEAFGVEKIPLRDNFRETGPILPRDEVRTTEEHSAHDDEENPRHSPIFPFSNKTYVGIPPTRRSRIPTRGPLSGHAQGDSYRTANVTNGTKPHLHLSERQEIEWVGPTYWATEPTHPDCTRAPKGVINYVTWLNYISCIGPDCIYKGQCPNTKRSLEQVEAAAVDPSAAPADSPTSNKHIITTDAQQGLVAALLAVNETSHSAHWKAFLKYMDLPEGWKGPKVRRDLGDRDNRTYPILPRDSNEGTTLEQWITARLNASRVNHDVPVEAHLNASRVDHDAPVEARLNASRVDHDAPVAAQGERTSSLSLFKRKCTFSPSICHFFHIIFE